MTELGGVCQPHAKVPDKTEGERRRIAVQGKPMTHVYEINEQSQRESSQSISSRLARLEISVSLKNIH